MQWIVEMRYRLVGAIDGECVLDQVVGADRQEIQSLQERVHGKHRRRNLDHPADRDAGVERHSLLAQRLLRLRQHGERLIDFAGRREHRDQDLHVAVMRRAEDRAKLSQKKPRLREAEADRPQSQRGIGRNARQTVQSLFVFVGAEIERTYRDRFAVHSVRDRAIRLELLVLRREARAIEEQKFGAEKSYAGGAVFQRLLEIVRKLDVRLQFDADAVDRFRRLRPQALQLLPRDIELVLLQPI